LFGVYEQEGFLIESKLSEIKNLLWINLAKGYKQDSCASKALWDVPVGFAFSGAVPVNLELGILSCHTHTTSLHPSSHTMFPVPNYCKLEVQF